MPPESPPPPAADVAASHVISCRGVRFYLHGEEFTLREQVQHWDKKASLNISYINFRVLPPDQAVDVVVTTFRNGVQRVCCPCLQEQGTCGVLLQEAVEGRDSLTEHYFLDTGLELPPCPYRIDAPSVGDTPAPAPGDHP